MTVPLNGIVASSNPRVGGTHLFVIPLTVNGVVLPDATGYTFALTFTLPPGSSPATLAVSGTVITVASIQASPIAGVAAQGNALAALGYVKVGSYTTLTTDLSVPGPWKVGGTASSGGNVFGLGEKQFNVDPA